MDTKQNNAIKLITTKASWGKYITLCLIFLLTLVGCHNNNKDNTIDCTAINDKIVRTEALNATIEKIRIEASNATDGTKPLHYAGNGALARALIEDGEDVNAKDNYGFTPLLLVAQRKISEKDNENGIDLDEVAKVLICSSADINAEIDGKTAIYLAAGTGRHKFVKMLIAAGADVNAKDNKGVSPLQFAVQEGHTEIVKTLLASGADVKSRDNDGWTSLRVATNKGNVEIVKMLIDAGSEVDAIDNDGNTPLSVAEDNGNNEIVKILIAASAKAKDEKVTEEARVAKAMAVGVGDIITFGHYEQDNDQFNGVEPIQWRILDKNAEGHLLIISDKVLDGERYNRINRGGITWENSTIRSFLNGYDESYNKEKMNFTEYNFINKAFTAEEQSKIVLSRVPAHANPNDNNISQGKETKDKIFLLSITEAQQYFKDDIASLADTTRYAIKRGVGVMGSESGLFTKNGTCTEVHCFASWWLRTSGGNFTTAFFGTNATVWQRLPTGGKISFNGAYNYLFTGFRPAMWIKYN